jgi:hypothetical protein
LRPRPEQDLATRIASTLREIGAPRESMDRLSLESDAPASGSGGDAGGVAFRTQTMRVSLRRLQLVELGRFLSRWRQEQPLWTVVSIGLARSSPAGGGGPSRGDAARVIEVDAPRSDGESATLAVVDERFDVALLLAATYAAEGAQASESGPRR